MSTNKNNDDSNKKLPINMEKELPYYKEIRASWIANKSHCDEKSSSGRENLINKGIKMSEEWMGEIGFLRYYLFHIDASYVPKKSKLVRIDNNKGFSKDNCKIITNSKSKPKQIKELNVMSNTKPKVISDMIDIFTDEVKVMVIKKVFESFGMDFKYDEEKKAVFINQ